MSAPYLVFDVETVLDPELSLPSGSEERLPPAPHHRVVVVGELLFDSTYEVVRYGTLGEAEAEAEVLRRVTERLELERPTLVTFNGRGFDLPVLAARCLRHGVPFPFYFRSHDVRYRFSASGHLDLMDYLAGFGATRASRLDVIAKLCGMPGKVGMDGNEVAPLVAAGRLKEVAEYCLSDVVQTAAVFLRLQLVRGSLERAKYRGAVKRLIELISADARLARLNANMDPKRLLLDE